MRSNVSYRAILPHFRSRFVAAVQLTVFVFTTFQPFFVGAYWTDTNSDYVKESVNDPDPSDAWWYDDSDADGMNNTEEVTFGSDPYRIDSDVDGLTDKDERDLSLTDPWSWDSNNDGYSDYDQHYQQIQGYIPQVNYSMLAINGQVFHSFYDADGDGTNNPWDGDPMNFDRDGDEILNWNDSYPDDYYNGTGPGYYYNSVWYSGSWMDSDSDEIPDPADSFPNGSYSYQGNEYGGAWVDADSDGVPDPADPFPNGSYWYGGVEYGGSLTDSDSDGIPDPADPFPVGSYWYAGFEYSGTWVDTDGDNIPDSFDEYPNDPTNTPPEPGYYYNSTWYSGTWTDSDNDEIPDPADTFPNGSYWWNSTEYAGSWVDSDGDGTPNDYDAFPNGSYTWNGVEYPGTYVDTDGDGIPNEHDAYPEDPFNGNPSATGYYYNTIWYEGQWVDSDGDGIPDPQDPFPNGSYWWNGTEYPGTYNDSDMDGTPDGQDPFPNGSYWWGGVEYAGSASDSDGDSIPDPHDPFPNGSIWWSGVEYGGYWTDGDMDNIPDQADQYPTIPGSYWWSGVEYPGYITDHDNDSDGVPNEFDPLPNPGDGYWYKGIEYPGFRYDRDEDGVPDVVDPIDGGYWYAGNEYFGEWADSDGDRIPDAAENPMWILDPYNGKDTDGDGLTDLEEVSGAYVYVTRFDRVDTDGDGLTDFEEKLFGTNPLLIKTVESQPHSDYFMVDRPDSDQDGIPDTVENWYIQQGLGISDVDPQGDLDGDGISNLEAYYRGWIFTAGLANYDYDGDRITDVREDHWAILHHGMLDKTRAADAVQDYDADGVLNFEEFIYGLSPANAATNPGIGDLAWVNQEHGTTWGMGVQPGDTDGDGMSDVWEHFYFLDLRDASDALLNPDDDSRSNIEEFMKWRHPRISDDPASVSPVVPGTGVDPFANTSGNNPYQPPLPTALPTGSAGDFSMTEFNSSSQGNSSVPQFMKARAHRPINAPLDFTLNYGQWISGDVTTTSGQSCKADFTGPPSINDKCPCHHGTADRFQFREGSDKETYDYYYDDFGNKIRLSIGQEPPPGKTRHTHNPDPGFWERIGSCAPENAEKIGIVSVKISLNANNSGPDMEEKIYITIRDADGKEYPQEVVLTIENGQRESSPVTREAPESGRVTITRVFDTPKNPPNSLNLSDGAGGRYRKVGLNGVPIPDAKPQVQSENGEDNEETYIDAFLAQLRHSVSDVYVTEASSQMPLMVRRDVTPDAWNQRYGLKATERPTQPFGPCWSSNLCSYVRFDGLNKAEVVDELGAHQKYFMVGSQWMHDRQEDREVKTRMNKFTTGSLYTVPIVTSYGTVAAPAATSIVLTKKFGTTCTYQMVHPNSLVQVHHSDRIKLGEATTLHTYARLSLVKDRWGNELKYEYPGDSLVPSRIYDPRRPGHQITLEQENGYVLKVRSPGGQTIEYIYDTPGLGTPGFGTNPRMLVGVKRGGSTVQYDYESTQEEQTDQDDEVGPIKYVHDHRELASIVDERGNAYSFEYRANNAIYYKDADEGTKRQQGLPRILTGVTSPITGRVDIENNRPVNPDWPTLGAATATASFTYATVLGPRTYSYSFTEPKVMLPSGNPYAAKTSEPITYAYTKMSVQAPDDVVEEYSFDPNASMALTQVKDRVGKITKFEYTDTLVQGTMTGQFYDDPTKEIDALNQTKTFTYNSLRLLQSVTDVRGVKTTYGFDPSGVLRTSETISAASGAVPSGGKTETYAFGHGVFKGFMTSRTLPALIDGTTTICPAISTTYSLPTTTQMGWWRMVTEQRIIDGQPSKTLTVSDFDGGKRSVTDPRGNTTLFDYDEQHRLVKVTHTDGSTKRLDYDLHGNLLEETDELGVKTFHEYDALNRRTKTTLDLNGNGEADGRYSTPVSLDGHGMPIYNGDLVQETVYDDFNLWVKEIDGRGIVTKKQYDILGRLISTTANADGIEAERAVTTLEYKSVGINGGLEAGGSVFDSSGFKPVRVQDARGNWTSTTYDGLYRPIKVTRPDAGVITTTYSRGGQAIATGDPALASVSLVTEDDPTEISGTLRLKARTAAPWVTQTSYDALGQPLLTTYADGKFTKNFYTPHGKVWKTIDEAGAETLILYNESGLPKEAVQDKLGINVSTKTTYDKSGNAVTVTDPLNNVTRTVYDARNRPVMVVTPSVVDATELTAANREPPPVSAVTSTGYDAVGRVSVVTDTLGYQTRKFYDAAGRTVLVFDAKDNATTMAYDAAGNVIVTRNAKAQTVSNVYDGLGRLKTTTDAEDITNTFGYDKNGNRTSVKDGKLAETTFAYDTLNRLTHQTYANLDDWGFEYNFTDKTAQVDALNRKTTYTYDKRHRLDQVKQYVTVPYPSYVLMRNLTYSALDGRLSNVTEQGSYASDTVSYTYDMLGRVRSETSYAKTHLYEYDAAGNRKQATLPTAVAIASLGYSANRVVTTSYDALNRPLMITDDNTTSTVDTDDRKTEYGYDKAGRAVMLIEPNGQLTRNTYDELGRLQTRRLYPSLEQENDTVMLAGFTWIYDEIGNVTSQSEVWRESGTQPARARVTVMAYDGSNRLETETVTDELANVVVTTYGYDDANNRTSKTVSDGTTSEIWIYTFNSVNQLTRTDKRLVSGGAVVGGASYTYDANGNRKTRVADGAGTTTSRTTTYTWDLFNRLTDISSPVSATAKQPYAYTYDYRMRRTSVMRTAVSGVSTAKHTAVTFSGGVSVAEYDRTSNTTITATSIPTVQYGRGPDMGGGVGGMLYSVRNPAPASGIPTNPTVEGQLTLRYSLSNGRGDIVAQSDQSGALTWTASYEAFGTRTKETGTNLDKQKANSKDEDPTGLLNEGYRYRDLDSGAFISRDPAGFVDGPNVYAYVKQNPWTAFDPDGLKTKENYREDYRDADAKTQRMDGDIKAGKMINWNEYGKAHRDKLSAQARAAKITETAQEISKYSGVKVDAESLNDEWASYKKFSTSLAWHRANPESMTTEALAEGRYKDAAGRIAVSAGLALLGGDVLKVAGRALGAGGKVAASTTMRAESSLQGQLLRQDLLRQEAASAFTATGELSQGALAGSREIIAAGQLGNPNIPAGFSKWSTRTFQSPAGDFQAHFYRNSITSEVNYGLDFKIKLSPQAPLWPGPK